jgi:hypothetical protein
MIKLNYAIVADIYMQTQVCEEALIYFLLEPKLHICILGVIPELVVPAVHSLADGLGCHVTTTLWDQLFRQTLVQGYKCVYSTDKEKVTNMS